MCQNCNFTAISSKREGAQLLRMIDEIVKFKNKKINEIALNKKQFDLLRSAFPKEEIEAHTPMRRHGVLLKLYTA
jgi:hypothetical protein